jgi:two-component system phosphate regulon response regulator PhoB
MKAHGGRLLVASSPGKGAFFSATLPLVKPVILVIDDDASLLNMIRLQLEDVGAAILEATDGKEAMPIITDNRPHVIVSDLHMPNMGGLDLLKWVRSDSELKDTPFIVLTSDSDIELRDQAFSMGANDFLTKPFPKQELIPRVRRFLI